MARKEIQEATQFSIKDAILIVFHHKWKIGLLTLMGLVAAGAFYQKTTRLYESQVKLLVRYVVERSSIDTYEEQNGVNNGVIDTESEILLSYDLALLVAEDIGVAELASHIPNSSLQDAANIVAGGLEVTSNKDSNVVTLAYKNSDPELAQSVLASITKKYFDKHLQIHRSGGSYDFVRGQMDAVGEKLRKTSSQLESLKNTSDITTYAETSALLEMQRTEIESALLSAQAELAQQEAKVASIESLYQRRGLPLDGVVQDSNDLDTTSASTDAVTPVSAEVRMELQDLAQRASSLRQQKLDLLSKYTENNIQVKLTAGLLKETNDRRVSLLGKYPQLLGTAADIAVPSLSAQESQATMQLPELWGEQARLAALRAKVNLLEEQSETVNRKFKKLSSIRAEIEGLERRNQVESEKYIMLSASLEKAQIDEALDPSKIPNITILQSPSPPVTTMDGMTKKIVLGIAGSGLLVGLAIAFGCDMLLDRRVRFVHDIETKLSIPVIMKIPYIRNRQKSLKSSPSVREMLDIDESGNISPEKERHFISDYALAIRDRLFYHFETRNLKEKPKLIAVTGQTANAGVSTVAEMLAAAFRGDNEAKVLLVDMNTMNATAVEGNPNDPANSDRNTMLRTRRVTLKAALSDKQIKNNDEIYLAKGNFSESAECMKSLAPRKLFEMMPNFRASEFDYVIFDMPVLSPTSSTVAMAGIMDHVLLVLDAENTDRDELKENYRDLVSGSAEVSCVYNKIKANAPKWLN
ncbi:MAG: GumC family protein [Akkermansiaceae bacterium]